MFYSIGPIRQKAVEKADSDIMILFHSFCVLINVILCNHKLSQGICETNDSFLSVSDSYWYVTQSNRPFVFLNFFLTFHSSSSFTQFHQHFTSSFSIHMFFKQLLSNYNLSLYFFGIRILVQKLLVQMLVIWMPNSLFVSVFVCVRVCFFWRFYVLCISLTSVLSVG